MSWKDRLRMVTKKKIKTQRAPCKLMEDYKDLIQDSYWAWWVLGRHLADHAEQMRTRGAEWRAGTDWMKLVKSARKADEKFREFRKLCDEVKEFKGWKKLMNGHFEIREDELITVWSAVVDESSKFDDMGNFDDRLICVEKLAKCFRESAEVFQKFLNDWCSWDEEDRRVRFAKCPRCLRTHTFQDEYVKFLEIKAELREQGYFSTQFQ